MISYIASNQIFYKNNFRKGILVIQKGKILDFLKKDSENQDQIEDYGDLRILPGLIDIHNHGTMGWINWKLEQEQNAEEQINSYLQALPTQGVTSVMLTLLDANYMKAAAKICQKKTNIAANLLGIYSEGPYLNRSGDKGPKYNHPIASVKEMERIVSLCQGYLKVVAMAPELDPEKKILNYLVKNDITVAFAHSNCDSRQAKEAIKMGYSLVTHLGNAMTGIHHREIGALGTFLLDPTIDCELIADNIHICQEMLQLIFHLKSRNQILLISDSTFLCGLMAGKYDFHSSFGPVTLLGDGKIIDRNGRISGSSTSLLDGVKNLITGLDMSWQDVLSMACEQPAKKFHLTKKGKIEIGYDADFFVCNPDFTVRSTYINGKKVYDNKWKKSFLNPIYHPCTKINVNLS